MGPVAIDGDSPYPAWKQNLHAARPPYVDQPPPKPKASPAPYTGPAPEDDGHSWTIQSEGSVVVASGGSVSMNTNDLDSLTSSLNLAVGSLGDVRTLIANVAIGLSMVPSPSPLTAQLGPLTLNILSPPSAKWKDVNGQCVSMSKDKDFSSTGNLIRDWGDVRIHIGFDVGLEESDILQALDALTTGSGSLEAVAGTLRGITSDATAYSQAHTLADRKAAPANGLVGPVDVRAFDAGLLQLALGFSAAAQFPMVSALLALSTMGGWVFYKPTGGNRGGQAAVEVPQLLFSDPTTEQWVKEDLIRTVLLARWLKNAKTGREAATAQAYLQQAPQRPDPWARRRLPGQIVTGTQIVDTTDLTPIQRVAMVLSANAATIGAGIYDIQSGITVTPTDGAGSTMLPPVTKDPFGLISTMNPGMTGKGEEVKPPQNIPETITRCQGVQSSKNSLGQGYEEAGVISIQWAEHTGGRVSWVVYVSGTTDQTSGSGESQGLLTDLEVVGGTPTATENDIVIAMRQAGVQPGEEIAFYGHPQGGIVVSNIAVDPTIRGCYNITTVFTAGSPTARADIPDSAHALYLENAGDVVPGPDTVPTPTGPHRQVAMLNTHQTSMNGYPHASSVYTQAVEGLEDKVPELVDWNESSSRISGAGEQGATTTEYTFAVQCDINLSGIYKGGATYQGKMSSTQPSYPRLTPGLQLTGEHQV